jgi:hypothetical protein
MRLTLVARQRGFTSLRRQLGIPGLAFTVAAPLWLAPAARAGAQSAPTQARAPAAIPGRVLGVFDERTGLPVPGAQVDDLLSGLSATTTETGTVALFFVDTGGTLLRVRKVGYIPQTLPVKNSVRDTVPITIVLKPAAQLLPTVVTKGASSRGPADTVRRLDLVGFYDRRNTQGAPLNAFITQEKIERFNLLSDVARLTGMRRGFCSSNLYIDGARVDVPDLNFGGRRITKVLKNGIDALLDPSQVVAIEFYTVADAPMQYNATSPAGKPPCGATLIWTK